MARTEPHEPPDRTVEPAVEPAQALRHTAPFRRPKPSRHGLGLTALWLLGVVVGAGAPALVVPPTTDGASVGLALTAFSLTVVGVAIMVFACLMLYRRGRDGGVLIAAVVPTGVLLAGGMMMLGTQLFL